VAYRAVLAAAALALVACGHSVGQTADARAPDARPDAALPIEKGGQVAFTEETLSGTMNTFSDGGFWTEGIKRTTRTDGPCTIEQQERGWLTSQSAGTLTVTYGTSTVLSFAPDKENLYRGNVAPDYEYSADEMIAVAAAGATVPAFTGSVTFPEAVTVTNPMAPFSAINKSGVASTWSPIASQVHIVIKQSIGAAPLTVIDCSYPGTDGTGAVPASALADLLPDVNGTTAYFVQTQASTPITDGDYALTLDAFMVGIVVDVKVD
jgi:hypothetical protein